jgi:hypothetical protein
MKRAILALALGLLAVLLATPTAVANRPEREELPPAGDFIDTFCGFPMLVDFEQPHPGTVTIFFDQEGNVVRSLATFPGLRVTLTNLETGETLAHDLSGAGILEFNADGSTTRRALGAWGIWARMNGTRGRFITVGRVVEQRDATGALVSRTLEGGQLIDVCAELAP